MTVRFDRSLWADVLAGLRLRAGRTLLAAGAIALGACALTVLLGAMSGLQSHAVALTRVLGNNTIALVGPAAGNRATDRLQTGYASLLAANLPGIKVSTMRTDVTETTGHDRQLMLVSTDENLASVRGWHMVAGRFIDTGDVIYPQRIMVITRALSEAWNWHVGQVANIRQIPFAIVGIVDTPPAGLEVSALAPDVVVHDLSAFVPRTLVPAWVNSKFAPSDQVDAIYMHVPDSRMIAATISGATDRLTEAGAPLEHTAWVTSGSLTAGLNSLRDMVAAVAGGVTVLSMILGGITLTSLMISNVQDRIAEIGLRRTFGAMPSDVAALFVVESLLLTLTAASAGMVCAVLWLQFGPRLPLPIEINVLTLAGPMAMGGLLGALSAWWPARLAAGIEPAQALRQG
ncbi:MAG: ABC transporter permease [Gammaproteobacteria bacterium]